MFRLLPNLFLLALASALVAQDHPPLPDCYQTAGTQSEMNRCASDEAKRTDDELNAIYRKVSAEFSHNARALAKLKAQERAWIRFRDAYLDAAVPAEDKQANYGSMFPMDFDQLRIQLTREQTARLHDLLNDHVPE